MALTMNYVGLQEKYSKPKKKKEKAPKPKKSKMAKIKDLINKHQQKIEMYKARIAKHEKHIKRLEQTITSISKPYDQLLKSKEWKKRRNEILDLKGKVCSKCGSTKNLQVHHLYYKQDCLPWEYPDDALIVLCKDCHEEIHGLKGN